MADDVSQNAQRIELYLSRGESSDLDNVAKSESPIIRILKKYFFRFPLFNPNPISQISSAC